MCRQNASKEGQQMNNLNFTQRQFIKKLMDTTEDIKTFDDLGMEAITALEVMTDHKTFNFTHKILEKEVNSFMSVYETQRQWDARKVAK
jgi:hypothetical protein